MPLSKSTPKPKGGTLVGDMKHHVLSFVRTLAPALTTLVLVHVIGVAYEHGNTLSIAICRSTRSIWRHYRERRRELASASADPPTRNGLLSDRSHDPSEQAMNSATDEPLLLTISRLTLPLARLAGLDLDDADTAFAMLEAMFALRARRRRRRRDNDEGDG